jgi:hypothetical protein
MHLVQIRLLEASKNLAILFKTLLQQQALQAHCRAVPAQKSSLNYLTGQKQHNVKDNVTSMPRRGGITCSCTAAKVHYHQFCTAVVVAVDASILPKLSLADSPVLATRQPRNHCDIHH